jgi:exonuclease VII large subunit
LQRHGQDILVAWDCDDPAAEIVIRVAYSLARALVVRQRRTDQSSHAAVAEIDRATRAVEKQISYLDDVRKWAETVQGHGQKIAERSARMVEELKRDVDRLDAQLAALRTDGA